MRADGVVRVHADTEMERVLAGRLDDVLVGADTGRLERLGRELLVLVGDKVAAEGLDELIISLDRVDGKREGKVTKSSTLAFLRPCVHPICRGQRSVLKDRHSNDSTNEIEDTDLRVGHTTVVPTLGVRLVLAVAVATSGTATHDWTGARGWSGKKGVERGWE